MKGKMLIIMALFLVLTGGTVAMAHGGNQHSQSNSSMKGMDMNGKDKGMDMKGMDMNGKDKNMDMSGSKSNDDMQGMNMGGDEPVKETPPNVKVLGTYGVVNLAFILIGIWNKWFRRKDGSYGNTK
ncbi:MAG: hypothetical protein Q8934_03580 [Bacillota bacterium]|nr:hypothetical protein [Bacillota bacterium]